jgi:hypothetical protein
VQPDPQGRFWRFDAPSLQPATQYELRITDPDGAPMCDAWPLQTFPAPDAAPERMRILAYTCAGGTTVRSYKVKTTYLVHGGAPAIACPRLVVSSRRRDREVAFLFVVHA